MVTFCIIHIGNRNIFLKHHPPPESQLILLHVSVFSYFTVSEVLCVSNNTIIRVFLDFNLGTSFESK